MVKKWFDSLRGDRFLVVLSFLSLVGIFLAPRFHLQAGAKVRLEDITFIFLFFIVYFRIMLGMFTLRREFVLPLIYFAYSFLISSFRAIGGLQSGFYFIFFWAKEFQYFVFFLVFYHLFSVKKAIPFLLLSLLVLIGINNYVGLYKIVNGIKDYYGIGAPFLEKGAAHLSAQVFYGGSVFPFLMLYFNKFPRQKLLLSFFAIISVICTLATGSKSISFGIIVFYIAFFLIKDICSVKNLTMVRKKVIVWGIAMSAIAVFVFFLSQKWNYIIFEKINLGRLRNPIESTKQRYIYDLTPKLYELDGPFDYLTGLGFMGGQFLNEHVSFTSAHDSQYIRNMLVVGIIGTGIWITMLLYFGWRMRGEKKSFIFYCALLISYLMMGIGQESFGSSKSGPIFWILTAILLTFASSPASDDKLVNECHS